MKTILYIKLSVTVEKDAQNHLCTYKLSMEDKMAFISLYALYLRHIKYFVHLHFFELTEMLLHVIHEEIEKSCGFQ